VNAELQWKASRLGKPIFLTPGEIEKVKARLSRAKPGEGYDRAWEYWCGRADVTSSTDEKGPRLGFQH
jgi:HCOMODA/2-hydroxy-3-carboxy-muconic semialdehyde decarboxylase